MSENTTKPEDKLLISHSFSKEFVSCIRKIRERDGIEEVLRIQGIAPEDLDIVRYSKDFFNNSASKNVADVSVDGNANVVEKSMVQYNYEISKSTMRLNSLYLIHRGISKYFSIAEADEAVYKIIMGEVFVNDLHLLQIPYSYYGQTTIMVRIAGKVRFMAMADLFELFSDKKEIKSDMEVINLDSLSYSNVDFLQNNQKKLLGKKETRTIKANKNNLTKELVIEKPVIEIWDSSKWVGLKKVLRHQTESKILLYQTESGNLSIVTDNHPVILETGQVRADCLKVGDKVIEETSTPEIPTTIQVDPEYAYVMGFMIGDGNACRHRLYGKGKVSLSDKETRIVYDNVQGANHIYQKDIVGRNIHRKIQSILSDSHIKTYQNRVSFNSLDFSILSQTFFGMERNDQSFNKTLPSNILSWDRKSQMQLLAGLIDAEGTLIRRNSFQLRMRAFSVLQQVQKLCQILGFQYSLNYFESIKCFGISIPAKPFLGICDKCPSDVEELSLVHDTNPRSNYIKKIVELNPEEWVAQSGSKEMEWVYDVTTETGTFTSGNMTQHNCYAVDLTELMVNGMSFYKGSMRIKPPKRSDSFIALIIQSTAYISNQISGAVSYPNFFLMLDYFYRKEFGDNYVVKLDSTPETMRIIKNQFQNLVYSLGFPFRSSQSAFTNLSILDSGFLESLFNGYVYPDGTYPNFESVKKISQIFFEYFTDINGKEGIFTFPVMTLAISLDKEGNYIDPEFVEWCSHSNCEKGLGNIFIDLPTSFSSCCRLRSDLSKFVESGYQNSFGVGGVSIGSHRVVGCNLPRLAFSSKNQSEYGEDSKLEEVLKVIHQVLFIHRKLIESRIRGGYLPLYTYNWMSLKRQYSTVGFLGLNEYLEIKGWDYDNNMEEVKQLFKKVEDTIMEWQKKDKFNYNIEQIPAEAMAVRLAEVDRILGFNNKYDLYSNQYFPLVTETSLYDRFRVQGELDQYTSGGAILHVNIDAAQPLSQEAYLNFINNAKRLRVRYFAVNYAFSSCSEGHFTTGRQDTCPICQSPITERYSRVVGFITNVKNWNKVRREIEFPKRVFYKEDEIGKFTK